MVKFKKGDVVRRIGYTYGCMRVGSEGIVEKCDDRYNLELIGVQDIFCAKQFVLVKAKEPVSKYLEVGKTYKRKDGRDVTIIAVYPGKPDVLIGSRPATTFTGISMRLYHKTGYFMGEEPDAIHSLQVICDLILPPPPVCFEELSIGESFHWGNDQCVSIKMDRSWFVSWNGDRWTHTILTPSSQLEVRCVRVEAGDKAITLTTPKL